MVSPRSPFSEEMIDEEEEDKEDENMKSEKGSEDALLEIDIAPELNFSPQDVILPKHSVSSATLATASAVQDRKDTVREGERWVVLHPDSTMSD